MERGGVIFPLLLAIVFGLMFFLPSMVINLRIQESIFPIVAIGLFLAGLIFHKNKAVACSLIFIIGVAIWRFTPASWEFLRMAVICGAFYLALVIYYPRIGYRKNAIYNTLCIIALVNVLWLILQSKGVNIFFNPRAGFSEILHTGFFANQNETSIFLAMMLPFFFRKYWHWGLIPMIAGLMLTKSSIGIIAVGIIGVIYLFAKFWRSEHKEEIIGSSLIAMILLGAFFFSKIDKPSTSSRIEAWKRGMYMIKAKPLLGWGIGQTGYILPLYSNPELLTKQIAVKLWNKVLYQNDLKEVFMRSFRNDNKEILGRQSWIHFHNDYLEIWLESGIIGLGLFLWVIISHMHRQADIIPVLSVLAIMIGAGAMFPLYIGRFVFLGVFNLALIQGESRNKI